MLLSEAATTARRLMNEHGLTHWKFGYDNAKRRFGQCRHRDRTITLSSYLTRLNSEEEVLDTILHEIAHALVGPGQGHNHVWKAKCLEVGARPERCFKSDEVTSPQPNWIGTCPNCTRTLKRYRLKEGTKSLACGRCCNVHNGGRYSELYIYQWRKVTKTQHTQLEFVDSLPEG